MAIEKEIRFALVLYGGASLAVYIHGVTLEFFHLVRATASDSDGRFLLSDAELTGTEPVYRQLGRIVQARFLIDIASGTSAGGINAIFLAKAFANGQTLDQISRLWIEQADIQDLLNPDRFPRSLLSSQTMRTRLLDALSDMEPGNGIPLQPEMDVFITATDIQGLELPIELADETVFEKRHRSVFHLRFGDGESQFARENNPLLAFAACATSAFPFAFEPAYLKETGRVFSDGGCLDNKPFTHAIQALSKCGSDLPVVRKLIYIEPSPDELDVNLDTSRAGAPPDFIRNTLDALITLPRDETIREDLQRVIERNRLIERVQEITSHVDADISAWSNQRPGHRTSGEEYRQRTLSDEIHDRGPGYAGYHRLKVHAVTDDLAALSRQTSAATDAWRRAHYAEQDPERSESRFLLDFDLGYRERRLRFLLRKLTESAVRKELNRIAATLKKLRRSAQGKTVAAIADAFREDFIRAAADAEACLGAESQRYFDQFEYYDQISFPVFYEASVGEAERCEVFRISPRDPAKLAGTSLFHFGAFLSREWRENDLSWGRHDAAERIIQTILPPDSPHANSLIVEANRAIGEIRQVKRRLPVLLCLSLAFRASRVILKMLLGYLALHFTRKGQRRAK